jgi:hypothetical protein
LWPILNKLIYNIKYLAEIGVEMQNILSGPFCNCSSSHGDQQMVELSWTGSEFTW